MNKQSAPTDINTYIRKVTTEGGDFIGRDKYTIYQGLSFPRLNYRSNSADIRKFYTEAFVGRNDEYEQVANLARQAEPSYLCLESPAGYGKTAFIAHLIDLHEKGQWNYLPIPVLLYFFIRQESGDNTSVAYFQAINSQLLDLLKLDGGVPSDINSLRGQFNQLWSQIGKVISYEKPLLLLIDSMDAMALEQSTIAHELPDTLQQPYVHIVLSSRPGAEFYQLVSKQHPLFQGNVCQLGRLKPNEVYNLLASYNSEVKAVDQLTKRVFAVTQGEPLFTRFVGETIARYGESSLENLEADPPDGVEAYFQREFDQLSETSYGGVTWDILGLLSISPGGLTQDEIAEILRISRRSEARKAIAPLRRYLSGESRLELAQRQLRELVVSDFYVYEQVEYRNKLLNYCKNYQQQGWPDNTPPFILMYYSKLLHAADQVKELYTLALDKRFRQVQMNMLGDAFTTLDDLYLAIKQALKNDDLVMALRCMAAYRDTLRSDKLTKAVFEATYAKDFRQAIRRARQCSSVPIWTKVMYLLIAWEASEADDVDNANLAIAQSEEIAFSNIQAAKDLCNALLVRTCRNLAQVSAKKQDPGEWLAQWRSEEEVPTLLKMFKPTEKLSETEKFELRAQLTLKQIDKNREPSWSKTYIDKLYSVTPLLAKLSIYPEEREEISQEIETALGRAYPRYRDLALLPLAIACVLSPDSAWARAHLQDIIYTPLDQEGITFTFDLPSVLMLEASNRKLPALELSNYVGKALKTNDHWGTSERAHSAIAAALFWQGKEDEAFDELAKPRRPSLSSAGYETITVLSLANRCIEFGQAGRARDLFWIAGAYGSFIDEAKIQALSVLDNQFQLERKSLVLTYEQWFNEYIAWLKDPKPNFEMILKTLSQIAEHDTRLAYIDHISARWASKQGQNEEGIKILIPLVLTDSTTLDALLARLFGLSLKKLSNEELTEIIQICIDSLITGKPWTLYTGVPNVKLSEQ